MPTPKQKATAPQLPKCPTGIQGLDEITEGGLPRGRPTLVCGAAGSGKTLLGMEFLVRGATQYNEPGVFLSFEETAEELAANVASLGFHVPQLLQQKQLAIDFVRVERSEIDETGEYDLEGLFIRLGPPSTAWGPSGWSWTPSRPSSPASPTRLSSGQNCGASSAG